jgi:hypothetical protein
MENRQCVLVRAIPARSWSFSLTGLEETVAETLNAVHGCLFARAKRNLEQEHL